MCIVVCRILDSEYVAIAVESVEMGGGGQHYDYICRYAFNIHFIIGRRPCCICVTSNMAASNSNIDLNKAHTVVRHG